MSYNYLPLDRKWLRFQQVKNLLDYDQLVSITFDAHERILLCREYLDKAAAAAVPEVPADKKQAQPHLIKSACPLGEEAPAAVVKLMLMLKIKSLSYGHSGVHIDTVKRLLDMYNEGVLPLVYTAAAQLNCLSLPLLGLGEVHYKGSKIPAAQVLDELGWQPLRLLNYEAAALTSGTQFISASGLYALKKAEQLLATADVIAALSYEISGGSAEPLHEKIQSVRGNEAVAATAAVMSRYLSQSATAGNENSGFTLLPEAFAGIPEIHGSAKDTFEFVLPNFLKEINSVTEDTVIFAGDDLVLSGCKGKGRHLVAGLDLLAIATSNVADISKKRTAQLTSTLPLNLDPLHLYAADLAGTNWYLCMPSSTDTTGGSAATKCLQVINNAEKILAIELLCAVQAVEVQRHKTTSALLEQFVKTFRLQVPFAEESAFQDSIEKAVAFVKTYAIKE